MSSSTPLTQNRNFSHISKFVLRNIPHATVEGNHLEYLKPDDEVSVAISRMVACEYSQMPVRAESSKTSVKPVQPHGVVTWQSITRALLDGDVQSTVCKDACDPPERFQKFSADTSVVDVVGVLFYHDFILTYYNDGRLFGIMTSADLVRWSDQHAMGLVEVRRLELQLRDICKAFAQEEKAPEEMDFKYYKRKLVKETKTWNRMVKSGPWRGVSHREFCRLFKKASDARNAIFHFKCEDKPKRYRKHRKNLTKMVRLLEFARTEPPS